ncbi:hypothetical protein ACFWUQ_26700 [Streptomyces sp. NPDC058662]|uniref:hypothetical protein n=1 Tax=Streptomyces sp. NPDC058662 TaxID=3346583 RepID=UPI00365F900C
MLAMAVVAAALPGTGAARPGEGGEGVGRVQLRHEAALFGLRAENNAAAQEFSVPQGRLARVGLYVSGGATGGRVSVQVRRVLGDAGSVVASGAVDLARIGGAGAGWLEVPVEADLAPGATYYLFAQATGTDGAFAWHGTREAVAGGAVSWNYDAAYWGGWHAEARARLAFVVNPSAQERCGELEACYTASERVFGKSGGLLSNGTVTEAVDPITAASASYVPGSNVLRLPSGRWRYLPAGGARSVVVEAGDPGAAAQVEAARRWLAAGRVPGAARGARREGAERALLSMRALLQPNGAFAAAWYPFWDFSWPRDGAFAAAAFAHSGYDEEAYRILRFDAATQRGDGTWEARSRLDGSGPPDARTWQLDANGWVPWGVWQWYRAAAGRPDRGERLRALYPMVARAADHAAGSLDARGLPPASPDYWELPTSTVNIGTAAPLLAGLNAAADLAGELGRGEDAARWAAGARRLSAGIAAHFAPGGYPRTADGLHGRDSAVAFMAPPFNTAPAGLGRALEDTYAALLRPNGGLVPGDDPGTRWGDITWTASTSFFALAWAGTGEREKAAAVVDWVLAKRNPLGELPETVDAQGRPAAVVPLGWTDALVVLALQQLGGTPLPTPPGPAGAS